MTYNNTFQYKKYMNLKQKPTIYRFRQVYIYANIMVLEQTLGAIQLALMRSR